MTDLSSTSTSLRPPSLETLLRPNSDPHSRNSGFTSFGHDSQSKNHGYSKLDISNTNSLSNLNYDDYVQESPVKMTYGDDDGLENSDDNIGFTNEKEDEYAEYNDPVLSLIASDEITALSLQLVLRSLPLTDKPLIKYINKAFTVLIELSNLLHKISAGWEFMALEKTIQLTIKQNYKRFKKSHKNKNDQQEDKTRSFDTNIAKTVVKKDLEYHQVLYELNISIIDINKLVTSFTPMQYVSDAGVVLTNLSLKIIELKNQLSERINVSYSKAKLIIMGSDLEGLLDDFKTGAYGSSADGKESDSNSIIGANHPIISNDLAATIEGYKEFVVTILNQLDEAQQSQESEEINECLAVIGDLEKMFDALMKEVYDPDLKPSNSATTNNATSANAAAAAAAASAVDAADYAVDDDVDAAADTTIEDEEEEDESIANISVEHGQTPHKAYTPRTRSNTSSAHTDYSSPTNSANFDNDTLYESDEEFNQQLHQHSRHASRPPSHSQIPHHFENRPKYGKAHRPQASLSSSATLGMSRSTSRDNFYSTGGRSTLQDEMPYLLHAFENAKEVELELRQSVKHSTSQNKLKKSHSYQKTPLVSSNSLSRISSRNEAASPRRERYIDEEDEANLADETNDGKFNNYGNYGTASFYDSRHIRGGNDGSSAAIDGGSNNSLNSAKANNSLYTGSMFIKQPSFFKHPTAHPINTSNPLIIKDLSSTTSQSQNNELKAITLGSSGTSDTPSTSPSSSIFGSFSLFNRKSHTPGESMSASIPSLPSNEKNLATTDKSSFFSGSSSMILKPNINGIKKPYYGPSKPVPETVDIDDVD